MKIRWPISITDNSLDVFYTFCTLVKTFTIDIQPLRLKIWTLAQIKKGLEAHCLIWGQQNFAMR